ncbi:L,D-transpeptidase family protein [Alicyclobacillus sp. ALC3]|uniref:L,D-transpeptidase family protein n=1 Tax=Alicyclobacillus sp. ALC3 TaxID=2796143 RepID=UPI00237907B1|nr:L,D-transpeptidase family protein [Alicyclobacillus sp. ALC3]WDL95548.1 murein L,D-transpeptidase [Alicyclobacillus sp. ALC3]
MKRVAGRWTKWGAIGATLLMGTALTGCGAALGLGSAGAPAKVTPVAKVTKATTTGAKVGPSKSGQSATNKSTSSSTSSNASSSNTGGQATGNNQATGDGQATGSSQTTGNNSTTGNGQATGNNSTTTTVSYPTLSVGSTGSAVLALNERLAELHYLPVVIANGAQPSITVSDISTPPTASFTWQYQNTPSSLAAEFAPNTYTALTEGAVIAFEHQNGLTVDGIAGPQVWSTLLGSSAKTDAYPVSYILVQKSHPETLQLWDAGHWVLTSDANTGVQGATTVDGTFPVYLRYRSQTMTGTNPNGTHYSDPGVPYVNYFNGGDAVHGFVRASYGFPQSDGCVELPPATAAKVWTMVHYGTLVTVEGKYS